MMLVLLGMAMGHLLELNDSHLRGFISLHTPSPCHLGQQAHRLSYLLWSLIDDVLLFLEPSTGRGWEACVLAGGRGGGWDKSELGVSSFSGIFTG